MCNTHPVLSEKWKTSVVQCWALHGKLLCQRQKFFSQMNSSNNNNKVVTQNWNGRSGNTVRGGALNDGNWELLKGSRQQGAGSREQAAGNWELASSAKQNVSSKCNASARIYAKCASWRKREGFTMEIRERERGREIIYYNTIISIELRKFSSTNWNYKPNLKKEECAAKNAE